MEYGINYQKINHIFISHMHGDHFLGLPGLINTMALNQRSRPLIVHGPKGLDELLNLHFDLGEARFPFELTIEELRPNEVIQLNSVTCKPIPVFHRIPCFGFLFEERSDERKLNPEACNKFEVPIDLYSAIKKGDDFTAEDGTVISNKELTFDADKPFSYGYITDTLYNESLIPHFQGVDVLYHEATYLNNLMDRAKMTFHSTAEQAAQFALGASANQLIIGHYSSRYESLDEHLLEARRVFLNTDAAVEGETLVLR